jgi:uncharacterized protein (TIGR03085 family)
VCRDGDHRETEDVAPSLLGDLEAGFGDQGSHRNGPAIREARHEPVRDEVGALHQRGWLRRGERDDRDAAARAQDASQLAEHHEQLATVEQVECETGERGVDAPLPKRYVGTVGDDAHDAAFDTTGAQAVSGDTVHPRCDVDPDDEPPAARRARERFEARAGSRSDLDDALPRPDGEELLAGDTCAALETALDPCVGSAPTVVGGSRFCFRSHNGGYAVHRIRVLLRCAPRPGRFRRMGDLAFDAQERRNLCDVFDELGPSAATLLQGWTTNDLAAHVVMRERDLLAGPCIVLPGPFRRYAERRRVRLAQRCDFPWLVARIRSGPPPGFFRIGWVRAFPNLNEFFVHHEDVRRANDMGPRTLAPELEAALWRNVRRGGRHLGRRLRGVGLEVEWAGTSERLSVRPGEPTARLTGLPGELLLFVFGRQRAAHVEVTGPAEAVAAVHRTQFGM